MSRPAGLAVLLVATGCALPERGDATRVAVPVPTRWQAGARPGEVADHWWRAFEDPALQAAIDRTLAHNHDLLAARARLLAAAAQARLAGAAGLPRLDAGVSATRQRNVFVGLPASFGGGKPLSNTFENYGVSLNASWEADLWGRIGAARDAATAELHATAAELRGLRQSLAAQTAKAWFAAVATREQIALAEDTVASFRATEAQVEDRFRRGVRPALDLRLARSRRMNGEAQLLQLRERFEQAVRQLQSIQGRYPDGQATVADRLPDPGGAIAAGLPAELVARRPDLVAATERLAAAGFRVEEAQAALYPQLSLSGGVGTTSSRVRDLFDLDFLIWNLAANLVAPLLDGGARREQRALAIAREHEAIAHFARTALQAYTEVETLLATEAILRQRGERLAAAATESVAARALSEDRYRRGVGDYIAVLEAQRGALAIQAQAIDTRQQLLNLRIDLHLALGGGFEPDPPAPESPGGTQR